MQSKLSSQWVLAAHFGLPIISGAVIVRSPFRTYRRDNTLKPHLARLLENALPRRSPDNPHKQAPAAHLAFSVSCKLPERGKLGSNCIIERQTNIS